MERLPNIPDDELPCPHAAGSETNATVSPAAAANNWIRMALTSGLYLPLSYHGLPFMR
jgi:hypothetical protein